MGLESSGEDEERKRKEGALKKVGCIYSWEGRPLPSTPWISRASLPFFLSSFYLSSILILAGNMYSSKIAACGIC